MKKRCYLFFVCLLAITFFAADWGAVYAIELADGKIVIHGKLSEQLVMRTVGKRKDDLYDYDIFNFRTTIKLETMFRLLACPDKEINLYSVWKEFYDAADRVDSGFHDYMVRMSRHRGFMELRSYNTFTDICRELYLEYLGNYIQVRLGKQIVSWGETSFERMTDIINPIDARGLLNPAYPDFAEIKRGLWMARFFITPPDMPSNLSFEFLVIPDFQPNRNWPAGYQTMHPAAFNSLKYPNDALLAFYRDQPRNWSNPEIGFRIKGFTWGTDWTLQYFHHRNDNPITREGKLLQSQWGALTGVGWTHDVKHYSWQHSIGATFSKPVDTKITLIPGTDVTMTGSVLRGEFITEIQRKVNQYPENGNVFLEPYKVSRNRYAGCLSWGTKVFIPGLTPWNRNKYLDSTTQLIVEGMPQRKSIDSVYPYVPFRPKAKHFSSLTESLSYGFWNDRIMPAFYGVYQIDDGSWYYTLAMIFKPTFRWTYMVQYTNFIDTGHDTENLDQILFDITYEF
jgi:hypothetical protein